jgi:hypothetical protein
MAFVPVVLLALNVHGVVIVGRAARGGAWTDAPTEARRDDGAELAAVLVARDGARTVYVVDDDVTPLVVGGRTIRAAARRGWAEIGDARVRWSTVEPHAWREAGLVAPNGAGTPYYSNVATGGARHGAWLGFDRITYFETPLGEFSAARRRPASASPPRPDDDRFGGLGTMRYKVEVALPDGRTLATPGRDDVDAYGIRDRVHRVSIRRDDTYLGWLSSFFLVPEVFGSAGSGKNNQTDRHVGADCADVLVGALRASGRAAAYDNVVGLGRDADEIVAPVDLDDDGRPPRDLVGIAPGDIIRIDYLGDLAGATPRSWDHVAVVWEDRSDPDGPHHGGPDGKLDGFDLVVHMGHPQLVVEPLARQAPARIDVLRWR